LPSAPLAAAALPLASAAEPFAPLARAALPPAPFSEVPAAASSAVLATTALAAMPFAAASFLAASFFLAGDLATGSFRGTAALASAAASPVAPSPSVRRRFGGDSPTTMVLDGALLDGPGTLPLSWPMASSTSCIRIIFFCGVIRRSAPHFLIRARHWSRATLICIL